MAFVEKIVIPTRPQVDTLVAVFILKKFGEEAFGNVSSAKLEVWSSIPEGESEQSLWEKGVILLDMGGGIFDHHDRIPRTTASDLVAAYLSCFNDPALAKLIAFARRDDFHGKGIISNDPLDRAFGLPGLLISLNKFYTQDPDKVAAVILPLLEAHHVEEIRRTKEMPTEFEELLKSGKAEIFETRQRGKKLKAILVESDNISLSGFLRSKLGGGFDVVAQWRSGGHINILTRPARHIDLRALAVLVRAEEYFIAHRKSDIHPAAFSKPGRIEEAPAWYFDPATNSLQNGGVNPGDIPPTRIPRKSFRKIITVGLSEEIWSPLA